MDWFWAASCALLALAAFAVAQHFWASPERRRNQGWLSIGLGYTIRADENPRTFDAIITGTKMWAALVYFVSAIGGLFALGWVWKAIV